MSPAPAGWCVVSTTTPSEIHPPLIGSASDGQNGMSGVGRLELGSVEFLVEVSTPLVGETVQPLDFSDPLSQTIPRKRRHSHTRVATGTHAKILDGLRREVPLVAEMLHDALVNRAHPVGALSNHSPGCACSAHESTDISIHGKAPYNTDDKEYVLVNRVLTNYL